MEENQLILLEQRINRAIGFIETLKSREKALIEEKDGLEGKVRSLEEDVREKDMKIDALKENQLFLKNKIEAVLNKLESLANLEEQSSGKNSKDHEEDDSAEEKPVESEIIIEENIVDLKDEDVENVSEGEGDEESLQDDDKDNGFYNVVSDDTADSGESEEDEGQPGYENDDSDSMKENTLFQSWDFNTGDEGERGNR